MVLNIIIRMALFFLLAHSQIQPAYSMGGLEFDENKPVLYYADSQTYDRDLGILILRGNVEFKHEGSILDADYVTYNEKTDLVTATGHVRLRDPEGDIYFGEYLELTGDLKEGIVLELRALLEDDSKIAALEGRKYEDREEFEQVVYTPCELCGDKIPTWQLNSRKAVKDNVGKSIQFTDTQFRILDVPLLYIPYASQPLVRKSGFLIPQPRYTTDSDIGFIAEIPYYIVLSDDKDITFSPAYLTGQKNAFLSGEYRQAFTSGMFKTEGSITNYRKSDNDLAAEQEKRYTLPDVRGHIFGKGAVDLTNTWRARAEGGYVSDKTYFRKYVFAKWQSLPALTSKGIVEGFLNQRDYAAANLEYYQGLTAVDQQNSIPAPLPFVEYKAFSDVDSLGGRFDFDGNFLNIFRSQDARMQRGIGQINWTRPWVIPSGQVFKIFGSVRGDLYGVENSLRPQETSGARFFPQAGIRWDWPFIANPCENQDVVFQPIVQVIGAPKQPMGTASDRIPDIDSLDFIFNDVNIFSPDRYPGYDLIDTGSRISYGTELITTGKLLGDIEFFLGQNYALSGQYRDLDTLQGLRQGASDYLGRIEATPWDWLKFVYRSRFAQENFSPRVSEVQGLIGPPLATLSGTYVFLNRNTTALESAKFNQLNITFSSQFTKNLNLRASLMQNLQSKSEGGGSLLRSLGLVYRDDCFTFGLTVQRQYFVSRDLRPQTLYLLTIGFKNVGDFPVLSYDLDKGLFGEKRNRAIE